MTYSGFWSLYNSNHNLKAGDSIIVGGNQYTVGERFLTRETFSSTICINFLESLLSGAEIDTMLQRLWGSEFKISRYGLAWAYDGRESEYEVRATNLALMMFALYAKVNRLSSVIPQIGMRVIHDFSKEKFTPTARFGVHSISGRIQVSEIIDIKSTSLIMRSVDGIMYEYPANEVIILPYAPSSYVPLLSSTSSSESLSNHHKTETNELQATFNANGRGQGTSGIRFSDRGSKTAIGSRPIGYEQRFETSPAVIRPSKIRGTIFKL